MSRGARGEKKTKVLFRVISLNAQARARGSGIGDSAGVNRYDIRANKNEV